jgi:hypothetical protein
MRIDRQPNGSTNGNGNRHRHKPKQPRLVDYLHNRADYECALLGALGFSTRYIQSKTSLRTGQITYRLRKAQVSRMDFRNGQSVYAQMVLRNMRAVAEPKLIKHLYNVTPPIPGESAGLKQVAA